MINRCENPSHIGWKTYGGEGIRVCERWRNSFTAFLEDVGERPEKGMTLDRVENSKGYEPSNIRWATRAEQAMNRRNNLHFVIDGETFSSESAAERFGLTAKLIRGRAKQGYTDRQIVGLDPLPGNPPITPAKLDYWAKRRAAWDARAICPNGHPWTKENELWEKGGSRKCRACHNERRRKSKT